MNLSDFKYIIINNLKMLMEAIMRQVDRIELILQLLKSKQSLTLREIMTATGASRDTARRDIVKLADSDTVERNYGGISLPNTFSRIDSFLTRQDDMAPIKQQLGFSSAKLVNKRQHLFFDTSTTVSCIPEYLSSEKAMVALTNSLDIADQLLRKTECQVRLLGGEYRQERRGTMDATALRDLFGFTFDMSFLSAAGLTEAGAFYAYLEDIDFKQQLRTQSKKVVLVLDHSRIGITHNYQGLRLDQIDYLVTDEPLSEKMVQAVQVASVTLVYTQEGK